MTHADDVRQTSALLRKQLEASKADLEREKDAAWSRYCRAEDEVKEAKTEYGLAAERLAGVRLSLGRVNQLDRFVEQIETGIVAGVGLSDETEPEA